MTNPNVREITDAEQHRYNQIGVHKLAREAFWHSFDACLAPLADKCEDLAHHYCANLWDQYKEGLVTASEFLNKLMDEMSYTGTEPMSPIDRLAAEALLLRADMACRKFAKGIKPIADQLVSEAVHGSPRRCGSASRAPDSWRISTAPHCSAYLFCHAVGSRLCDLDRENNLA